MGITEKQRHDLFTKFEETLGPEHAETMMELLPPVGWADVSTKRDVDAVAAAMKRDFEALEARMVTKDDLHELRRDLATWLFAAMGVQTAVIGLLLALI